MTHDKPSSEFNEPLFEDNTIDSDHLQRIMQDNPEGCPDLTQAVMAQLNRDMEHPIPCQYDFEFISTYFDNELTCESTDTLLLTQRIQTFEQHLPQCPTCNESLGHLFELTRIYRNHLYQLETRLEAFDCTAKVMQQFSAPDILDESLPLPKAGCGFVSFETLCAYMDETVPDQEVHILSKHLGSCLLCQAVASELTRLCKAISGYQTRITNTLSTPNLWPSVKQALETTEKPAPPIIPLHPIKKKLIPITSAAIAASILAVLFSFQSILHAPQQASQPKVDVAALEEALILDEKDALRRKAQIPTVNVIYKTPETYLFASDPELPQLEDLDKVDVSVFVMEE